MTKPLAIFVAFIAISCFRIGEAESQLQTACNPELFKDYSTGIKTAEETFAVLDIIDNDNFSAFKQHFSGDITIPIYGVPVDFGASYSSFDQKDLNYINNIKLFITLKQLRIG
jgi:Na+-translocating ferredoxin:NAD+ oxidoreductase RnfE subunit